MGLGVPPSFRPVGDAGGGFGDTEVTAPASLAQSSRRDDMLSFLSGEEVEENHIPTVSTPVDLDVLVDHAIRVGASDILIQAGDNVAFKVRGDIVRAPEYGALGSLGIGRAHV